MTTANGIYKYCDDDNHVSLTLTCSGPNCVGLQSNLTCTQPHPSYWVCNNNITCSGSSRITSNFSLSQTNITVTQTQNTIINGTSFVLTGASTGNVTAANQTTTSPSSSSTASLSPSAKSSSSQSLSATTAAPLPTSTTASFAPPRTLSLPLLIVTGILALLVVQAEATVCVSDIANAVGIAKDQVEGNVQGVAQGLCEHFAGSGIGLAARAIKEARYLATCSSLLLVAEAVAIVGPGAALAGGGVASGAFAVAPEALFALSAVDIGLCIYLVDCMMAQQFDSVGSAFCSEIRSTATSSPPQTPSSTSKTTATSATVSTSTSALNPSPTPGPPPGGLSIPSVAQDPCASCQLSVYAIGIQDLAAACNVATPLGTASDVSVLLCDSSLNGRYNQFCATLCANTCATYNIKSWIQSAGSEFMPTANLSTCAGLCPGFRGNGRCSAFDTCRCAIGSSTCVPC